MVAAIVPAVVPAKVEGNVRIDIALDAGTHAVQLVDGGAPVRFYVEPGTRLTGTLALLRDSAGVRLPKVELGCSPPLRLYNAMQSLQPARTRLGRLGGWLVDLLVDLKVNGILVDERGDLGLRFRPQLLRALTLKEKSQFNDNAAQRLPLLVAPAPAPAPSATHVLHLAPLGPSGPTLTVTGAVSTDGVPDDPSRIVVSHTGSLRLEGAGMRLALARGPEATEPTITVHGDAELELERAQVTLTVNGGMHFAAAAVTRARLRIEAVELLTFDNAPPLRIEEPVTLELEGKDLHFDVGERALTGHLVAKVKVARPSGGELERTIGMRFAPGRVSFDAPSGVIDELLDPVAGFAARRARIPPADVAAAGASGSAELRARIQERTGAVPRAGNRVELLVDGVRSRPRRLELIESARESICLQALIFKQDRASHEHADALIAAARRGVRVRVILDALGNIERIGEVAEGKAIYKKLRDGGVELRLFNDPEVTGLRPLVDAVVEDPDLADITDFGAIGRRLTQPLTALRLLTRLMDVAKGRVPASAASRQRVRDGLTQMARVASAGHPPADQIGGDGRDLSELVYLLHVATTLNRRWHEKHLIVDGQRAILGGMNVADEYLFGGDPAHPEPIVSMGVARPAWRDTDVLIEGPAAADAYQAFARNWLTLTGETLPPPSPPATPVAGETHVQIVQHRPGEDGDHHTAAVLIEALATLEAGQRALISNAYFLPTAALTHYREALVRAARRGVDVRVLTNSRESTDEVAICDAAVYPYRELVAAGVKLFERTSARTMHQKVAVLGGNTCLIGSWNSDNRSETFNSEVMAVICCETLARQMEAQFEADCCVDGAKPCARPILAAQLEHRSPGEAWRSLWAALQAELL